MNANKNVNYIINLWENMQPWNNVEDIPDGIPNVDKEIYIKHIIPSIVRCGGIPKNNLKKNTWYFGSCRNSNMAYWDGKEFLYNRYKFGSFYVDKVNHFEDDDGYDLFIPFKEIINCNEKLSIDEDVNLSYISVL